MSRLEILAMNALILFGVLHFIGTLRQIGYTHTRWDEQQKRFIEDPRTICDENWFYVPGFFVLCSLSEARK